MKLQRLNRISHHNLTQIIWLPTRRLWASSLTFPASSTRSLMVCRALHCLVTLYQMLLFTFTCGKTVVPLLKGLFTTLLEKDNNRFQGLCIICVLTRQTNFGPEDFGRDLQTPHTPPLPESWQNVLFTGLCIICMFFLDFGAGLARLGLSDVTVLYKL